MIRAVISYSLIIFSLVFSISLATFSPGDLADLSSSVNYPVLNWLGSGGAKIAGVFILFYGQASWLWGIFFLIAGLRLIFGISPKTLLNYFFSMQYLSVLAAIFLSCIFSSGSYLEGGIFGALVYRALQPLFPDFALQVFFGLAFAISLALLWKLPRILWAKLIAHWQAVSQQKQWANTEKWVYVDEQPVKILEEPVAREEEDAFYLNKKRLTRPEEPSFLRDADVDLTEPYKKSQSTFYDILEENRLELDDMEGISTEYTVAPDSLDELENAKVFRIPAVEQTKYHEKYMPRLPDYYNRTEDFVKPAHKTIRLSFDEGFIDAAEYEQESARQLKNEEYHMRRTETALSELDHESYTLETTAKTEDNLLISDTQYMQTLSLLDHSVAFDKLSPQKEILLDEYGFYKEEPLIRDDSLEEITDPHRLILPEIFELPDQNIASFAADELRDLTETEAELVKNLDEKNNQKSDQYTKFQEKIRRKQQELADQYHQLYTLSQEENFLAKQPETELQRTSEYFDPEDQNNETALQNKDAHFSIFDGSSVVSELSDEIRFLSGNDKVAELEPEAQEIPVSVFDDFFLEQNRIPIAVPEYNFSDQKENIVTDPESEDSQIVEDKAISEDLLKEMIMPEPSDDQPAFDEEDNVDSKEIKEGTADPVIERNHNEKDSEDIIPVFSGEEQDIPTNEPPKDWEKYFFDKEQEIEEPLTEHEADPPEWEFEDKLINSRELEGSEAIDTESTLTAKDEDGYEKILFDNIQSPIEEGVEKDFISVLPEEKNQSPESPELDESDSEDLKKFHDTDGSIIEKIPDLIPEISDLDQAEAALLPKFATQSRLVPAEEYPIQETTASEKPAEIVFPRVEDLDPNLEIVSHELEDEEIEETIRMIEDTFESFNIQMKVVDYSRGPAITRFELEPPPGLKLRTIRNLQDDLALQAGTSNIRIISPVEGRSYIGIEIPNKIRRQFLLREFIESKEFQQSDSSLPLILGTDIGGKVLVSDLATTPHLLVAGTTGSGKSVYINALVVGLLFKLSADDLKFIMIDPKMVELELYNGIPHLLAPIITKPEEAMAALEWAVNEMERRYKILSENGVRNIKEYQSLAENSPFSEDESGYEKLPYIVIIVDEFANLMLRSPKDTEKNISRLAAMARAVGMHLVVATQRPSVDVVTGVIKANFPCRVAFRVSSKIDSRTILDKNGAETLLGRGDMLFMSPEHMDTVRIQSPYVSGHDVEAVVNAVKKNGAPDYAIDFEELLSAKNDHSPDGAKTDALSDPLFAEVLRYAVDSNEISASAIQRRFRVGYNRASRLIETMKDLNIITPPVSAGKGWQVHISKDQIADYIDF